MNAPEPDVRTSRIVAWVALVTLAVLVPLVVIAAQHLCRELSAPFAPADDPSTYSTAADVPPGGRAQLTPVPLRPDTTGLPSSLLIHGRSARVAS